MLDVSARVTVSSKNRITLPATVSRQLGINSGDTLLILVRDGYAVLMPEPGDYSDRLRGLHREIWQDVEPQAYVRQEREVWGEPTGNPRSL